MTNLKWNSMLTLLMVWWWRATCSRGPAMPLRPGTGMLHRHDWMYWMLVMLWKTWEFICFYCHHFFTSVLVRPLKLRHHLRHCVKLPFLSSFSFFSSVMENNLSQNVLSNSNFFSTDRSSEPFSVRDSFYHSHRFTFSTPNIRPWKDIHPIHALFISCFSCF